MSVGLAPWSRWAGATFFLDREPGPALVAYVGGYLKLLHEWWTVDGLAWGPRTDRRPGRV